MSKEEKKATTTKRRVHCHCDGKVHTMLWPDGFPPRLGVREGNYVFDEELSENEASYSKDQKPQPDYGGDEPGEELGEELGEEV